MALALGSWLRPHCSTLPTVCLYGDERSKGQEIQDVVKLPRPRFESVPYTTSSSDALNARLIQPQVKPAKFWRPQRGWGKKYQKPTPQQSLIGSILGALCSVGVSKAVMASYDHLSAHPLAHSIPFGLTDDVNQAFETTLLGLGWLAISLFAASSVGLALLTVKLWVTPSSQASSKSKTCMLPFIVYLPWDKITVTLLVTLFCAVANVDESLSSTGAETFQRSCMGCHAQGGNILQPGATLREDDLQRNGLSTVEDIFNITYYGKGRMPGFGAGCKPQGQCTFASRLSDDDIRTLSEFVKNQARQGWPLPPQ